MLLVGTMAKAGLAAIVALPAAECEMLTNKTMYARAPLVNGTKQWVCPGCSKRGFWSWMQCRRGQKSSCQCSCKLLYGNTTGKQLLRKEVYKKQREDSESRQNQKQW